MSTRATYCFMKQSKGGRVTGKHFCYIHYDGYPEGAAMYFYATLMNPSKGDLATQFIRAISLAELTESHDIHADTDYRYDIVTEEGKRYTESSVRCYQHQEDRKILVLSAPMHDFITRKNAMIEGFKPFKFVQAGYAGSYPMNETMAARLLDNPVSHLRAWKGKYEGHGNWNACLSEAQSLVNAFPALMTDELREFGVARPEVMT